MRPMYTGRLEDVSSLTHREAKPHTRNKLQGHEDYSKTVRKHAVINTYIKLN